MREDPATKASGGRVPRWEQFPAVSGGPTQTCGRHQMGHDTLSADEQADQEVSTVPLSDVRNRLQNRQYRRLISCGLLIRD